MDRVQKFFSYLSEGADLSYGPYNFTKEETKELLSNIGITSGSFEIKVGNSSQKYVLDDNGNVRKDK